MKITISKRMIFAGEKLLLQRSSQAMALRSVWRRFIARKHKRSSFYDSQDVMRRASEAESAARRAGGSSPESASTSKVSGGGTGYRQQS
jgi:hypothetical protein